MLKTQRIFARFALFARLALTRITRWSADSLVRATVFRGSATRGHGCPRSCAVMPIRGSGDQTISRKGCLGYRIGAPPRWALVKTSTHMSTQLAFPVTGAARAMSLLSSASIL